MDDNERFLAGRDHISHLMAELRENLAWTSDKELKDVLLKVLRKDLDPNFLAGVRSYLEDEG